MGTQCVARITTRRDHRADVAQDVGEDVQQRAAHVERMRAARQYRVAGEIRDHAQRADHQHGACIDARWRPQPQDRFDHDPERQQQQHQTVDERRQNLPAVVTVTHNLGRRTARGTRRGIAHRQCAGIRQQMRRIGKQCQGPGDPASDRFGEHESGRDPQRRQ